MKATLLLALALARTVAPRQQVILIAGASPVGALVADRLLWRRHGVAVGTGARRHGTYAYPYGVHAPTFDDDIGKGAEL